MLCLSYYLLCFLFKKTGEEGRTGSAWKRGEEVEEVRGGRQEGEMAQTMYTHRNKL
jgi:hypothetical protein